MVSGIKEGTAELVAKDSLGEVAKQQLKVTKREALVKSCTPDKSTYARKEKFTCTIKGGKKPYHVMINPVAVAKATQTGPDSYTIEIGNYWKVPFWIRVEDSIKQFVQWQVQVN